MGKVWGKKKKRLILSVKKVVAAASKWLRLSD